MWQIRKSLLYLILLYALGNTTVELTIRCSYQPLWFLCEFVPYIMSKMLSLLSERTICTSVWQEHQSNSLLSVCIWMVALISKLCILWASTYQHVVQRVLWHWTCPENSLLNRVCSQPWAHVRQKNIVPVRARATWKHVGDCCLLPQGFTEAAVFLLISSLCHLVLVWIRLHFQPPPRSCDVLPGSQRVSLMTGPIPLMHAALLLRHARRQQFAYCGLKTYRCCRVLETRDRMWLWLNTRRMIVW